MSIRGQRIIRVAPICEVGWFCPGTRAGDGLPFRGQTKLPAMTPLEAWDRFEEEMRRGNEDATYIVLYADFALRTPRGKLTETLRREIEYARELHHRLA